jgi:hypothetical protein
LFPEALSVNVGWNVRAGNPHAIILVKSTLCIGHPILDWPRHHRTGKSDGKGERDDGCSKDTVHHHPRGQNHSLVTPPKDQAAARRRKETRRASFGCETKKCNPNHSFSMATALVQPADARRIFTGKHATRNPVAGRISRL